MASFLITYDALYNEDIALPRITSLRLSVMSRCCYFYSVYDADKKGFRWQEQDESALKRRPLFVPSAWTETGTFSRQCERKNGIINYFRTTLPVSLKTACKLKTLNRPPGRSLLAASCRRPIGSTVGRSRTCAEIFRYTFENSGTIVTTVMLNKAISSTSLSS